MMIKLLFVILTLMLIISCTNSINMSEQPERSTQPEITVDFPSSIESPAQQDTSSPKQPQTSQNLLDKGQMTTNYHYVFDEFDPQGYEVSIAGDKVKKVYFDPVLLRRDIFYTTVYFNFNSSEIIVTCEKPSIACGPHWKEAFRLLQKKEHIYTTPAEILKQVHSPNVTGSETFDNRALTIIEYTNKAGQRERLSVDQFSGLPVRQRIYTGMEQPVMHTFTKIQVEQVKESQVTVAGDYVLQ